MRSDIFQEEVLEKCAALKAARIWLPEPDLRPRAWLENFEKSDRPIAAVLLDRFNFYSDAMTEKLLVAAYQSLADGLPKGPTAPTRDVLVAALGDAVFTRVDAEKPRPTDSGNLFCRKARQILGVSDERFIEPRAALAHAGQGKPVVFLDDIVGSGDQFLRTWKRKYSMVAPHSFQAAYAATRFVATYVCLVATTEGLSAVNTHAPAVAVSVAHVLDESSTVRAIDTHPTLVVPDLQARVDALLAKYAPALVPAEDYMASSPSYKMFGYKERGLLLAFEHCVPDLTLPIYWSNGPDGWEPLRRRS